MANRQTVLVVDDHPLFRAALELALVKSNIKPENIHCASRLSDAIPSIKKNNYSLILLDLNLPDSNGFEGLSKIQATDDTVPVLIVSATETKEAFVTANTLGASGYIPKSSALTDITKSIETTLSGEKAFPIDLSHLQAKENDASYKLSSLTPAQNRVMSCLSSGLLNKQIAFEMGISEATVKAHMTAIFRKLGANNRTQALLVFREAVQA